jgi:hypothetical protein
MSGKVMCRLEKYSGVKGKKHPAYFRMSAEVTFLGQFKPELAVRI